MVVECTKAIHQHGRNIVRHLCAWLSTLNMTTFPTEESAAIDRHTFLHNITNYSANRAKETENVEAKEHYVPGSNIALSMPHSSK